MLKRISRRQLLALGAASLGGLALGQQKDRLRIGVVIPTKSSSTPVRLFGPEIAGDAARMGAVMGGEEVGGNAGLMGKQVDVLINSAPNGEAALRAAQRLVASEEVFALVGGFGNDQAAALSKVAAERKILFYNIGNPSDSFRGEACNKYTFHVEASAAMYLDALIGWFVRAGFRRWFFVYPNSADGQALYKRMNSGISQRHWGAQEAGKTLVGADKPEYKGAIEAIRKAKPQVVMALLEPFEQLNFLTQYDAAGLNIPITGFPYPVAQTRDFYIATKASAPKLGTWHRASTWEARLDAYGARELNSRFMQRWGTPMDASAWAAYETIKMLFEVASFADSIEGNKLVEYIRTPSTVFDIHKGIGISFRPWDNQMRQSLYLVKTSTKALSGSELNRRFNSVDLVGELPAIYRPGTDPIERLDQLGDGPRASRCKL